MRLSITATIVLSASASAWCQCNVAFLGNAASYESGLTGGVAPGELLTIFGSQIGPAQPAALQLDSQGRVSTMLGGVQVLFDGIPAPLIYASDSQIAAIVPYDVGGNRNLIGRSITTITLPTAPQCGTTNTVLVAAAKPGVFTANSAGFGQAAAANSDGSINSAANPAKPGSVVTLYITGAAQTNPPATDGSVANTTANIALPVTVTIGGQNAPVSYAGAAPGIVNGIYQINATVPSSLPYGGDLPVVIEVGDALSQNGVTIAVTGGPVPALSQWPQPYDPRFKGANSASSFITDPGCAFFENCELHGVPDAASVANAIVPLPMQPGCGFYPCDWQYNVEIAPRQTTPFTALFRSGFYENLKSDLAALNPTVVVTSLNLNVNPVAGSNFYALAALQESGTDQFSVNMQVVPAANLPAYASQEGAQGRVITAMDWVDSATLEVLSYGRQNDNSVYETQTIVSATGDPSGGAAANLAAAGYFITAATGSRPSATTGFVLAGTRLKGNTAPRTAIACPFIYNGAAMQALFSQGYTIVAASSQGYIVEN